VKTAYLIVSGGGLAAVLGVFGYRRAAKTKRDVQGAVDRASPEVKAKIDAATTPSAVADAVSSAAPPAPSDVQDAANKGDVSAVKDSTWYTGQFGARLTNYHPLAATTDAEKKMEGAPVDRIGKPLNYLEDALAGKVSHCSVSGDPSIFPYGQALRLDAWPNVVFRVTDTGDNFRGRTKVYRVQGREPLDICTRAKNYKIPELAVATIVKGDTLDKSNKTVAVDKFQGQKVVVGARSMCMLGAWG
jgi:hypothetical protein